ncbi:hypothetical protein PsorP6_010118 [Peronosclerospora sorghi]|uniref:Uncharacterized protein n=1 Tax=Peronosclerospora sorghi TaxID=230839 RepID=A0ACC0VUI5_9STRA|nr:hypothetical protein PsorP6_010118 [Peronosclerospora sorghi]
MVGATQQEVGTKDPEVMQREIPCNKFYRGAPVKVEEVYQSTSSIQETIFMLASLKCHVLLHVKAKLVKIEDQVTLHIG